MGKNQSICAGILALSSALAMSNALAFSEMAEELDVTGHGVIGLGVGSVPDYEGSDDNEGTVAPFGRYNWSSGRYISLGGTANAERAARLKMDLLTKETPWELGPVLQYRMKRDDVDNNQVDNMKDVDSATEAGAFLGWSADRMRLSTTFVTDVSDEYNGSVWYLNGYYDFPINEQFKLSLGAHVTWASDNYMETYFGVDSTDAARSGLPRYSADSGFKDSGLSVIGNYQFNKTWGMAGLINYTHMMNDAKDSPLVDDVGDKDQYKAFVAVTYSF
jgi:outer membrane protein